MHRKRINLLPTTHRLIAATFALTTATALVVAPQAAYAETHRLCPVVKHSNTSDIVKVGTATATVGADGVKVTTAQSTNDDKVSWKTTIDTVLASKINEMNYETMKLDATAGNNFIVNDAALPAYTIFVKNAAGQAGSLVWEPYRYLNANPQRGQRSEWNVMVGPVWLSQSSGNLNGIVQSSGGSDDPLHPDPSWTQLVTANPQMTVTGFGWNLGTYNNGVIAIVDDVRMGTTGGCNEHQWSTGFVTNNWFPQWTWNRR
jgi:hypothetical protein